MNKINLGGKGLVDLVLPISLFKAGHQVARSGVAWIFSSLSSLYVLLSLPAYTIQKLLPNSSKKYSRVGPPVSIISQENVPQACSQSNVREAIL